MESAGVERCVIEVVRSWGMSVDRVGPHAYRARTTEDRWVDLSLDEALWQRFLTDSVADGALPDVPERPEERPGYAGEFLAVLIEECLSSGGSGGRVAGLREDARGHVDWFAGPTPPVSPELPQVGQGAYWTATRPGDSPS